MANIAEILIQAKDQTGGAFASVKQHISQTEKAMTTLNTAFSAIAVGAIANKMAEFGKSVFDAGEEIGKAAQKTGIAVGDISILKDAAYLADVEFNGLQTAAKKLASSMYEANNGNKEMASTFAALGIATTNADGSLRPINAVLSDLSKAFAEMPDGAQKSALAVKFFGKAGTDMIPMLNDMNGAIEKAKQFGTMWSEDDVEQANKFNDTLKELTLTFNKLLKEVLIPMAPELIKIVDSFIAWTNDTNNFRPIAEALTSILKGIALAMIAVATEVSLLAVALGTLGAVTAKIIKGEFRDSYFVLEAGYNKYFDLASAAEKLSLGIIGVGNAAKETKSNLGDMISTIEGTPLWNEAMMTEAPKAIPVRKPTQMQTETAKAGKKVLDRFTPDPKKAKDDWEQLLKDQEKAKDDEIDIWLKGEIYKNNAYDEEMRKIKELSEAKTAAEEKDKELKKKNLELFLAHNSFVVNTLASTLGNWAANSKMNISQVWEQMRSSMINYFVTEAAQRAMNYALTAMYTSMNVAQGVAVGTTLGTAYATPAAFASIMTMGGADVAGSAGLASTVALAQALAAAEEGTDFVPKTGIALIHKGEMITPAKYNPMNPDNANKMARRSSGHSQPVIIHDVIKIDGFELGRVIRRMESNGLLNLKGK